MSWKARLPDRKLNSRFQPYIFIAAVLGSIALIASITAIIIHERYRRFKVKRVEDDTRIARSPDSMYPPPPAYYAGIFGPPGTFGPPVTSVTTGPSVTSGPVVPSIYQFAGNL